MEAAVKERTAYDFETARIFPATRAQLFAAWTSPEQIKQWFSPAISSVASAHIDFRPGGAFEVCVRGPDGMEHLTHGRFLDILPDERLVIDMPVAVRNRELFIAHTTITFTQARSGTRMALHQSFTLRDPMAPAVIAGAPAGWAQAFDKLASALEILPSASSLAHATFSLEHYFDAPPSQLFAAFASLSAKSQWFIAGERFVQLERRLDFRRGGQEYLRGRWPGGIVSTFDATYLDIVDAQRIIYSYEMFLDSRKISVSLASLDFSQHGRGTRLTLTEQGAFLDGYKDGGARERSTRELTQRLVNWIK
jgi:uncharacterized protein YndB with AHSA1/START domain